MVGSDLLTVVTTQRFYRYVWFARNVLKQEVSVDLLKSWNCDDSRLKSLDISHLDDALWYTVTTVQLSIIIRAASSSVKAPIYPA